MSYWVTYSREGNRPALLGRCDEISRARQIARQHGATKRDRPWSGHDECWCVRGQRDAGIWIERHAAGA